MIQGNREGQRHVEEEDEIEVRKIESQRRKGIQRVREERHSDEDEDSEIEKETERQIKTGRPRDRKIREDREIGRREK